MSKLRWISAAFLAALWIGAATAAVISQGYPADGPIDPGTIVALGGGGKLEAASSATQGNLLGVVVNPASSSIEVSSSQKAQVQVATSGVVSVLVSDLNGAIKPGDQIAASPIAGVGMKLDPSQGANVIGSAQAAFDSKSGQTITMTVSLAKNKTKSVKVGRVDVLIVPGLYTPKSSPLNFLQEAGTTVAGKQVSSAKALLATVILLVSILSVSVLLYTSVRSSLVSIGRNPLAEAAVRKELLRVLMVSLLILVAALGLIYVILRT